MYGVVWPDAIVLRPALPWVPLGTLARSLYGPVNVWSKFVAYAAWPGAPSSPYLTALLRVAPAFSCLALHLYAVTADRRIVLRVGV